MFYQEHTPHPGLKKHIKYYWTLSISTSMPTEEGQQFLAEGTELFFNFGDPIEVVSYAPEPAMASWCCISGPMTQPMRIRMTGRVEIFGVCFRPGGAYPFFSYVPRELVNGYAEIDDIWGSMGLGIVDRIQDDCHNTRERIDFLDCHFLRHLDKNQRMDPCIDAALDVIEAHKGQVNIDLLASLVGLSSRQLERRFKELVGLSPKQLCRILRFKNVFKHLATSPTHCWVSTALDCGYFDQSHMIRDFKHYTGTSPAAYFARPQAMERFFTGNF